MSYAAAAPVYRGLGFAPIPVKGKFPPVSGATGRKGAVTDESIAEWSNSYEWGGQNIALRADGYIAIDIDHGYEGKGKEHEEKRGADQLAEMEAEHGSLPATPSSTARGQDSLSRQKFFLVPEGIEFNSKPAKDIEVVQAHHRYSVVAPSLHPDTLLEYVWYDAAGQPMAGAPAKSDFATLPDAWIEFLRVKEAPVKHAGFAKTPTPYNGEGFSGTIEGWLNILPQGEPSPRVAAFIRDLPTEDFGHDVMIKWAFRAIRLGAENQTGVRQAIEALHAAWTREPYNTDEYHRSLLTALEGGISKAGALEEPEPALIQMHAAMEAFPAEAQEALYALVTTDPEYTTDAHLRVRRADIARFAYGYGMTNSQALTLVWNAKATRAIKIMDPNGLTAVWHEILEARVDVVPIQQVADTNTQPSVAVAMPAVSTALGRVRRIEFLTPEELEYLAGDGGTWWGSQYIDWASSRVKAMNLPYHNLNRWAFLSLVFSPLGAVPLGEDDMCLNLFAMVLGKTTTGKTAAMNLLKRCISAYFGTDSPDIGGDATSNSLVEKLIMRDGKPSFFNADEAHGLFAEMQGATWRAGLMEKWTALYETKVPMMLRSTKAEMSGVEAKSYFVMHLMGTEDGMTQVMDKQFWTSGFLARYVWAIGEDVERTKESMKLNLRRGESAKALDDFPKQWAAEFRRAEAKLGSTMGLMDMTPDAENRLNEFTFAMNDIIKGHQHQERLIPTSIRFTLNILKCASLVALSEGTRMIDLRHVLIAIDQAGEWFANILHMVAATDDTGFSRNVNKLEKLIASKPGQAMPMPDVYTQSPVKKKNETDELINQLVAEGRITNTDRDNRNRTIVRIQERINA